MDTTYPSIVTAVCAVFGTVVFAQWLRRRRPQQLLWSLSLFMGAVGALAFIGFQDTGSPFLFRLYYIFGALLNAAYLGMGSLYLVVPKRTCNLILAGLVVLSAIGVALLLVAPIDSAALVQTHRSSDPGTSVLRPGVWLVLLIAHNLFGAIAVMGVAVYSMVRVVRRQAPRRFALANLVIAVGVFIISQAGSSARLGLPHAFWTVMSIGFATTFAGFLLTTLRVRVSASDSEIIESGASPAGIT